MKKIAQIGSFDVENFGDLLFPFVLEKKMGKDYIIDLFSPHGGKLCFSDKVVYPISELEKKHLAETYDAIIIGGGDVIRTDSQIFITSDFYELSSLPSLQLWVYPICVANKYNLPVILNSVGVTNDFSYEEKNIVKAIFDMVDYCCVRDTESQKALNLCEIENVDVIPDTVLCIKNLISLKELSKIYDDLIKKNIVPDIDDYVIFQHNSTYINDPEYYNKLIECIKHVSCKQKILLMPIGYIHNDDKVLEKIYQENIYNVYIVDLKKKLNPKEMISIINKSSGYIGTSMHGALVSYSYEKPIMIINVMNSKKLHGFSKISGYDKCDINNLNNFCYAYDNFFKKIVSNDLVLLKKNIDDSFDKIKKIVDNKNKIVEKSGIFDFILNFYSKRKITGYYCNDINSLLDRKVVSWNIRNGYCEFIPEYDEFYINVCNQKNILIKNYNFEIIDKFDGFMIADQIFLPKNSYLHIRKKETNVRCIINIVNDDLVYKILKNNYDYFTEHYKDLEKKYIQTILRNKE